MLSIFVEKNVSCLNSNSLNGSPIQETTNHLFVTGKNIQPPYANFSENIIQPFPLSEGPVIVIPKQLIQKYNRRNRVHKLTQVYFDNFLLVTSVYARNRSSSEGQRPNKSEREK